MSLRRFLRGQLAHLERKEEVSQSDTETEQERGKSDRRRYFCVLVTISESRLNKLKLKDVLLVM